MVSIILFLLATVHMVLELYSVYVADDPIKVTQASVVVAMLLVGTLRACTLSELNGRT
jgi:hypothetical protein